MRISCVLTARELAGVSADLIVFPEGVSWKEVKDAESSHPDAVITGAIVENSDIRGLLLHRGHQRIDYLKVLTDERTVETRDYQQNPVYECGDVCIGVLICRDVSYPKFSPPVIEKIRTSSAKMKVLCVPADMDFRWFTGDGPPFLRDFEGVHLLLCNHTKTYKGNNRCKSFITNTHCTKIAVQRQDEPIHMELSSPTSNLLASD